MNPETSNAEYKRILQELDAINEQRQTDKIDVESLRNNLAETINRRDLKERQEPDSYSPISSILKDEIILISFLILYVGLLSTDSYYSYFGIKYQLLHLASFHVIYRGLTVLITSPPILIPYSLAIIFLGVDSYAAKRKWIKYLHFRNLGIYLILLFLLALTYPLAVNAGRKGAKLDVQETTSSLPRIIKLTTIKEDIQFDSNPRLLRLLIADSDYIVVFEPIKAADGATFPRIKRYPKGEVYVLETID